jgi:hypothetical protein
MTIQIFLYFFLDIIKFFLKPEIIALIVVWIIFKISIFYAKKSLFLGIREDLEIAGEWFMHSYDENSENKKWYSPFFMVMSLRKLEVISSFFSSPYILFFGKDFLRNLTFLNQGIERLNRHIDRQVSLVNSQWEICFDARKLIEGDLLNEKITAKDIYCKIEDWEKNGSQKNVKIAKYLRLIHSLNKSLHIDGIGKEKSDYKKGKNIYGEIKFFYNGHESWKLAVSSFKKECEKKYFKPSTKDWQGVISDYSLLLFLLFSYVISIL